MGAVIFTKFFPYFRFERKRTRMTLEDIAIEPNLTEANCPLITGAIRNQETQGDSFVTGFKFSVGGEDGDQGWIYEVSCLSVEMNSYSTNLEY